MKKLRMAIEKSWLQNTSYVPKEWSSENPARGQCAVTALVVQDYMDGHIIRCEIKGTEESHFFNCLGTGEIVDFTCQQFDDDATYINESIANRMTILNHPDTQKRYEILKQKVQENYKH